MSWPASFWTGPLGANNVVPDSGVLLGMWGGVGGFTQTQQRTFHLDRMRDANRGYPIIQAQIDELTAGGVSTEDWINSAKTDSGGTARAGSIPAITWSPAGTIAQILAGSANAAIDTVATRYAAKPYRIIVRLFHEFNDPRTAPWTPTDYKIGLGSGSATVTTADFNAAWQLVVGRFLAKTTAAGKGLNGQGINNVGFWWCPIELAGANATLTWGYWPGDGYVDWAGTDRYNSDVSGFTSPIHAGWAEFGELFDYTNNYGSGSFNTAPNQSYANRWGPVKPFILGETGSKYDTANIPAGHVVDVNRKANWYRNIGSVAIPNMPNLHGIVFFDRDLTPNFTETHDWRVDHDQPSSSTTSGAFDAVSYQGWKDFVATQVMSALPVPVGGGAPTGYTPTVWVNNTPPPLSAVNLNKLTNELKAQALETNFAHTLSTWVDGAAPALTDAAALNEIERCLYWISNGLGLTYLRTTWEAGWTPGRNAYQFNKMEQQLAANRAVLDAAPPPVTTAYFVEDWSTGRAETARWDAFYSYSGTGAQSTPLSATTDGRVAVVNDPARAGRKALRVEIRDTDPKYPNIASGDKSECTSSYSKTWGPGGFPGMGVIRWFDFEMYFPYNATEKYEWPHNATGGASWALFGLHPPGGSTAFWSAIHVEWNPYQFRTGGEYANWQNVYLNFHAEGGTWNGGGSNPNDFNYHVMPMTDANGNRLNYDRWVRLVFGVKFNPDNTGWLEIWCDDQTPGVLRNVVPRVNRPTAWDVDVQYYQSYFKYGIYDNDNTTTFPSGASVMYFGRTTIGPDRPF